MTAKQSTLKEYFDACNSATSLHPLQKEIADILRRLPEDKKRFLQTGFDRQTREKVIRTGIHVDPDNYVELLRRRKRAQIQWNKKIKKARSAHLPKVEIYKITLKPKS